MKNITIAGRCTKDAEVRRTQDGTEVAGFSVAVDDGFGQNKSTLFFDCSIWGKRADKLAPMLTKGKQVTVSGDLGTREYNGKTYLTIRVADVTLQGGKRDDQGPRDNYTGTAYNNSIGSNANAPDAHGGYGSGGNPNAGRDIDDEIPFAPVWQV